MERVGEKLYIGNTVPEEDDDVIKENSCGTKNKSCFFFKNGCPLKKAVVFIKNKIKGK